jgi:hypothetical protein
MSTFSRRITVSEKINIAEKFALFVALANKSCRRIELYDPSNLHKPI